jgi:pimeloyl-ACP methyl ester carboxylesterase
LHVIHRPKGKRKVDIVFVHGLGGTSRLTWSKNKDLDLFWSHNFLPLEPDIVHARISTFSYDPSFRPGSSRNVNTFLDFAKDLLFQMKFAKDESNDEQADLDMGRNPIIFVVHSMGGLVVKEVTDSISGQFTGLAPPESRQG